jgi:hypothetical protein
MTAFESFPAFHLSHTHIFGTGQAPPSPLIKVVGRGWEMGPADENHLQLMMGVGGQ